MIRRFLKNDGATAIEYGLIVAVLSLAIVAGVGKAGNAASNFCSATTKQAIQSRPEA